ncbi:MAG: hypothetical protein AAFV09_11920, partial [Pseudomonadota bacterium]
RRSPCDGQLLDPKYPSGTEDQLLRHEADHLIRITHHDLKVSDSPLKRCTKWRNPAALMDRTGCGAALN